MMPVMTTSVEPYYGICPVFTLDLSVAANFATTYQWKKDSVDISGANSPTYTASEEDAYTIVVGNASCTEGEGAVVETRLVSEYDTLLIGNSNVPSIGVGGSGGITANFTASFTTTTGYPENVAIVQWY